MSSSVFSLEFHLQEVGRGVSRGMIRLREKKWPVEGARL